LSSGTLLPDESGVPGLYCWVGFSPIGTVQKSGELVPGMDIKWFWAGQSVAQVAKLKAPPRLWFSTEHDRRDRDRSEIGSPMISVIIPAHNEERYLPGTLDALANQTYRNFELLVIANGCTDGTPEIAKDRCHRLVVLPGKGLGRARNLGADLARGDILIFLDADTVLEPDALERVATGFTRKCAAGTIRGVPDSPRLKYRLLYGLKNSLHRLSLHGGSAGTIICWRDDFQEAGQFDEALQVMENSELIRRLCRFGKYKFIGRTAAVTSMRRYDKAGMWKMFRLWLKLWAQSFVVDLRNKEYETVR